MNVCGACVRCVGKCVLRCEVKKQDTQERPDGVLVCGVQKKKGETEMCGVKMKKEGDREEREKPGC